MEILSEGAIELNNIEVFNNCSYSCYANIADALNKLKEYEDIGLTADEIKLFLCDFGITVTMRNRELSKDIGKLQMENDYLQLENHMLKAEIRGKDNEINDLKARIKYLEQFKPKTTEIMKQGN